MVDQIYKIKEENRKQMEINDKDLIRIYNALSDDISRDIFKHRLLYSVLGDNNEITKLVYEASPASKELNSSKVCYYGAGAGCSWLIRCDTNAPFVIDKFKTGTIEGHPIISLDDFLKRPDCTDYLIIVTVGKEKARKEISEELKSHGLKFLFAYLDLQYFDLQYFDLENLNLGSEFFADVGALDGETTKYFFDHFKGGHAYVFEPNPKQFEITRNALSNYTGAELFPYGLYDENTTLNFSECENDAGSAKISDDGKITIEVRKMDDLLKNRPVTFIKMDIEGSELAALRGAEQIIREQRPKLAICVYHKPEDIWEIPSLILDYHPDYRLYLRHYSISYTETVLYAI